MQLNLGNGFYMATFNKPHGYRVGDRIHVHGANHPALNGTFTVHSVQENTLIMKPRRWWHWIWYKIWRAWNG
jgi:hypothetical protein